ncbi:MAG: DUF2092 domain-containing protein [Arenimonas sp.]|nr:DUF2092 domain-containing protein [Arenimonas sp.]
MINKTSKPQKLFITTLIFASTLFSISSSVYAQSVDQDALAVLKNSTNFLAAQQQFSVNSESVLEVVLANGQKIQFDNAASMSLKRPNKLKAQRAGELVDQQMFYDGKTFTLFNPGAGLYATEAMPANLDAMLDKARDDFDIIAPASDLIYSNAFERLTKTATSGYIVGNTMIDGKPSTHLAFRTPGTDWQIWIADGAKPLPLKFVVTSVDVEGSPQFEVRLSNWNLAPNLADSVFEFKAPAGSQEIDFIVPASAPSN